MTYGAARQRKVDANCKSIVQCLRELGFRVHVTNGDWDLTVQYGGLTVLAEVRPADKPKTPRKGRQEAFQQDFSVYWLQTPKDCLELRKTLLKWSTAIRIYKEV